MADFLILVSLGCILLYTYLSNEEPPWPIVFVLLVNAVIIAGVGYSAKERANTAEAALEACQTQ